MESGLPADKWFSEVSPMWPGRCFSLEIEEMLYNQKSKFQQVTVFKSKTAGMVLCLDGVVQATESDEFSYQEMISHLPLFAHPNPKNVLVIGGGDGGAVREICRHKGVEHIDQCEIDEAVIEVSKKYLPGMACAFDDPRVHVHIGDGLAFVREKKRQYDVVIVDSSDPVGPAESLFGPAFYQSVSEILAPGGIVCCQCENVWLHLSLIEQVVAMLKPIFKRVQYSYVSTPTYPGGQIGFVLSTNGDQPLNVPAREPGEMLEQLRYYDSEVHRAAFVLPRFARLALPL